MVEGVAKLIVDFGNSNTRVMTQFGLTKKGNVRSKLTVLDNQFSLIPEDELPVIKSNSEYTEENSRIFKENDSLYCNGVVCRREYDATSFRPSALDKKYRSISTRLAMINAFMQGYEDITEFTSADYDAVNVKWDVTVMMPAEDIDSIVVSGDSETTGGKMLGEMIKGITSIDFVLPEVHKNIELEGGVKIFPEGFCALIAVLFEKKGSLRSEYSYLLDEDNLTLICDIGAGTTDMMLAQGSSVISKSRFTKEVGGNNISQRVRSDLRKRNFNLREEMVQRACTTGTIKSGNNTYSIVDELVSAKKAVANQIIDAVQEFFEREMIPIKSVNNLLVCGGGSIDTGIEGVKPIAQYMVEYLETLSANDIGLVEIPKRMEDGEEVTLSPRLLNIYGAGIMAE